MILISEPLTGPRSDPRSSVVRGDQLVYGCMR